MPENNQILSVEGQLIGMPTAGPESFSQQQLDYLKRALGVDETVLWEGNVSGVNAVMNLSENYTNFERLRFVANENNADIPDYWCEVCTNGTYLYPSYLRTNSNSAEVAGMWIIRPNNSDSSLKITGAVLRTNGSTSATNPHFIRKVVGIRRKESA